MLLRIVANAYLLAFDNTGGVVTGVAVNNASAQAATVPVIIRNESGAQVDLGPSAWPEWTQCVRDVHAVPGDC